MNGYGDLIIDQHSNYETLGTYVLKAIPSFSTVVPLTGAGGSGELAIEVVL